MKAFMLFTGSGPLVILTSHQAITAPGLLEKFAAKGIDKFIAHEIRPCGTTAAIIVVRDPYESDDRGFLTTTSLGRKGSLIGQGGGCSLVAAGSWCFSGSEDASMTVDYPGLDLSHVHLRGRSGSALAAAVAKMTYPGMPQVAPLDDTERSARNIRSRRR